MASDPPTSNRTAAAGLWQKTGDDFILTLGNCITEWSNVEHWLFNICLRCLGCHPVKAAIVYYRTPSIDARLSLADELVQATLPRPDRKSGGPHPDLKTWREIETEFRGLLPIRNQLAHPPGAD